MPTASSGYFALFKIPRVTPVFAWASLARLQFGVIPLALVLLLATQRQSYAEAGAVTAGYALAAGLLGPPRAHLADRHGHGRTIIILSALNAVALMIVVWQASAPLPILVALSVIAGSLPAPVGPVMRSTWRVLTTGDEQIRAAYSLDSVSEEVLFIAGPVLAAAGVARCGARVVLTSAATALFVAAVGLWRTLPRQPEITEGPQARGQRQHWRSASFLAGLAPAIGIGVLLGAFDLAVIASVITASGQTAAGLPAAALSLGSIVGGLAYGRRRWPGQPLLHAMACVGLSAACAALAAAITAHLLVTLALVSVTGLFVAPAIVASYLVADTATTGPCAETTSWVNSAFNVGIGAGTALSGPLIDSHGPAVATLAGAAVAIGLTLTSAIIRGHQAEPVTPVAVPGRQQSPDPATHKPSDPDN